MALPIEMVHGTGLTTVEENNEWRFGEQTGGVVSVTIVPYYETFSSFIRNSWSCLCHKRKNPHNVFIWHDRNAP